MTEEPITATETRVSVGDTHTCKCVLVDAEGVIFTLSQSNLLTSVTHFARLKCFIPELMPAAMATAMMMTMMMWVTFPANTDRIQAVNLVFVTMNDGKVVAGRTTDPTGGASSPPAVLRWSERESIVVGHPPAKGSPFTSANVDPIKGQQNLQGDPKQEALLWL